ncbi:MAG: hypothetical protein LLG42_11815 [Chloroflexi bacterium]|nr:hypothetical protein [Chloroflexota bacterium]
MAQEALNFVVDPDDVTDELIVRKCKSLRNALRLCRDCSPLTDKEIINEIKRRTNYEYQQSHFTEGLNGGRKNIDPDHIAVLEDICFNWIPTRYMALSRNCELRPKKEAYEIALERERAEREKIQLKYETLMEAIAVKR